MLALLQRVTEASVNINGKCHASISKGLLIFVGFEENDTLETALILLKRCFNYRIFPDDNDKMNFSLKEIKGQSLIVPQFTLVANTKKGLRPSFSKGLPPEKGHNLFLNIVEHHSKHPQEICFGVFGADMKISLCNDGPVTFLLSTN